jgi:hypothetical protein
MAHSHCETNAIQHGRNIHDRRRNVRITYHWGTFVQPLLWKSNKYYTFRECAFVAVVTRHALRSRLTRIMFSSVTCLAWTYISTLSHSRHDFREKVIEHREFVLIFSTTFVWNISHSKKNWVRYYQKIYIGLHVNTRYSCQVSIRLEFCRHNFEKILQYQISWKSVQ